MLISRKARHPALDPARSRLGDLGAKIAMFIYKLSNDYIGSQILLNLCFKRAIYQVVGPSDPNSVAPKFPLSLHIEVWRAPSYADDFAKLRNQTVCLRVVPELGMVSGLSSLATPIVCLRTISEPMEISELEAEDRASSIAAGVKSASCLSNSEPLRGPRLMTSVTWLKALA